MPHKHIEVDCTGVFKVHRRASLIEMTGHVDEFGVPIQVWIPHSQVQNIDAVARGYRGSLWITKWILEERGVDIEKVRLEGSEED